MGKRLSTPNKFPVINWEAVQNLFVQKQIYFNNIMQLKLSVAKKDTLCQFDIPLCSWHGSERRAFRICLVNWNHLHSICPAGQQLVQLVAFHHLSSGTESLLLIDWKKVQYFILHTKWFRLDTAVCSHEEKSRSNAISSQFFLQLISCLTENGLPPEEPPQPLSWTFISPSWDIVSQYRPHCRISRRG